MVKHNGGSHTLWERFSPTGPGRLEMVVGKKKKCSDIQGNPEGKPDGVYKTPAT